MARTSLTIFERGATPIKRRVVLNAVAADKSFPMPAGARITDVYIFNRTANAVTGGIDIGSTDGGQQFLAAQAVAANGLYAVKAVVVNPVAQTAGTGYITAASAWNSAVLDIVIEYEELTAPTYEELGRN